MTALVCVVLFFPLKRSWDSYGGWHALLMPQAERDARDRAEYRQIMAEAEAATEQARLNAGPTPEEQAENSKHQWLGGGGRLIRMIAREGLDRTDSIPEQRREATLKQGLKVVLFQHSQPGVTSPDVVVADTFNGLKETLWGGLEHRRKATDLAFDGVIFSVPRGTLGTVMEWQSMWPNNGGTVLVHVQFGSSGTAGWVSEDNIR